MNPDMMPMPYYGSLGGNPSQYMQTMPYYGSLGGGDPSQYMQTLPYVQRRPPPQLFPQIHPQQMPPMPGQPQQRQQQQRGPQNLSALGLQMMSGQGYGGGAGGLPYGMSPSTLNPQWPWDKPGYQAPDLSWLYGGQSQA